MIARNHYLIAKSHLRTKVRWNGHALSRPVRKALETIASWRKLDPKEEAHFQEFAPSGRRSYVCVLNTPLETSLGQFSAIKLKGVGNTTPLGLRPPSTERYEIDPYTVVVKEDGAISVEALNNQPLFGRTYERVRSANAFIQLVNGKVLPAPYALGAGEYPDLKFRGQTLGYNILAVRDLKTENTRLGDIFLLNDFFPEDYLMGLAEDFFPADPVMKSLEYLFYAAGKLQREYNDRGLITNNCHAGNFSLTQDADAILNDLGGGKDKAQLSVPQIATYQLLDLNRFIYSVYALRGWVVGDFFLSCTHPVSAYLEGYFGKDIFNRYGGKIGTPEKMLRALKPPRPDVEGDNNSFLGSVEIRRYSWLHLYQPLQEVLAAEGNEYPLSEEARIERHVGIMRSFFRKHGID